MVILLLWGFKARSAASPWRRTDVSLLDVISNSLVDSNTVWVNSRAGKRQKLSSSRIRSHVDISDVTFIHFLIWLSHKPGAPRPRSVPNIPSNRSGHHSPLTEAERQEAEESRSRTRVSMVPSLCWQKEKTEELKMGGCSCTKGPQTDQLLLIGFIGGEGRLQTPRTSTKYEITSKWLTWERTSDRDLCVWWLVGGSIDGIDSNVNAGIDQDRWDRYLTFSFPSLSSARTLTTACACADASPSCPPVFQHSVSPRERVHAHSVRARVTACQCARPSNWLINKIGFANWFSLPGPFFEWTCGSLGGWPAHGSDVSADLRLLSGINRGRFVGSLGWGRGASVSESSPRSQITASQGPQELCSSL